jgi:type II secretory pathway pseudopilin PulG
MQLTHLLRTLRTDERGFAMPAMTGLMMILGIVTAAVLSNVQTDTVQARKDQDRKLAYSAAEAGLSNYMFRLQNDPHVWTRCTSLPGTPFVNQVWNGTGSDPRTWRSLPTATSQYTVELLPKPGQSSCSTSDPTGTVMDNGVLRVRATGRSRGVKRSVVAKFRRKSFLDYLYFTHIESLDPAWYTRYVAGAPTIPDITAWATANCGFWRDGRGSARYSGNWYDSSNRAHAFTQSCTEIQFASADEVRGPMHTNDEFYVCGSPDFGRTATDAIEVSAPPTGWRSACSGSSPNFIGTFAASSPQLTMPPTNTALRNLTLPDYIFTGRTNIVLTPTGMTVNGTPRPYPANGLIYVQNGTCGQTYRPYDAYGAPAGCADVFVHGEYGADLTIASAKDIVIDDDLTKSGDHLLGLVANDFVRMYHPVTSLDAARGTCTTASGSPGDLDVEAALLALNHSVMVDNYYCGGPLGTLAITGAIVQKYRGPVGTGGSSISNGYVKDYDYDNRLKYREPPHFLDPVQSSWRILSQTEQVPAR